jgi:glycerol-3-phosphate acyltransferase PlsX
MSIVLDAMGSDNYPEPEIHGAIKAAEDLNVEIILVGQKELFEKKVNSLNTKNLPITIEHAPDMVDMGEKAVESSRKKPKNSMAVGMELVRTGKAEAFVTAGNTGGAMFNALRKLGRFKGVLRPGLVGVIPVKNGYSVIIDIGANADCRPEFLLQFAIMGSVYAEKVLNVSNPRVGLMSNGEEPGKGNQLVKDTFPILSSSGLNFIGNIEGKEFYGGEVDVAVTDGFSGNVMIKASEAVAKLITDTLKQELTSSLRTKIGALLAKPAFEQIRKMLDPSEVGAFPLLGINGLVFVGHGRSDARSITNAIKVTHQAIKSNLLEELSNAIQKRLA